MVFQVSVQHVRHLSFSSSRNAARNLCIGIAYRCVLRCITYNFLFQFWRMVTRCECQKKCNQNIHRKRPNCLHNAGPKEQYISTITPHITCLIWKEHSAFPAIRDLSMTEEAKYIHVYKYIYEWAWGAKISTAMLKPKPSSRSHCARNRGCWISTSSRTLNSIFHCRWWPWLGLLRGSFCYEFGAFFVHHRAGGPMTGTLACLFWLWWVGGHTSYGSFGLVSCWVRERLGQCPAQFDSFDLRAGAHERGSLRFELCISFMPRLYVQEGGLFLGLCTGWRPHFGAICIEGVFMAS